MRVFRHGFALDEAIGSRACSLDSNMRVINSIPLGCQLPLTVSTVTYVATLVGPLADMRVMHVCSF